MYKRQVFDIEVLNQDPASICAIGIVELIDGEITSTYYSPAVSYTHLDVYKRQMHNRWNEMDSRDRLILIVLALLACVPFSFSIFHVIGGIFGGLFGVGFSIITLFFCLIFGFWIITLSLIHI